MRFPVQTTLMYFSKLCDKKKEFAGFDYKQIKSFFNKIEKDYPKIFDESTELSRESELDNFNISGIIKSIVPYYHPHFISPGMSKIKLWVEKYKKYKEHEKDLEEIAQKFYDELGCSITGKKGKHTGIKLS